MKNKTRKKNNCERREACTCSKPNERPYCIYWIPSRGSKYYNCGRYQRNRITCALELSACAECPFYIPNEEGERPPCGAPNTTGINWQNKDEYNQYMKYYMRARRKASRERKKRRDATDEK